MRTSQMRHWRLWPVAYPFSPPILGETEYLVATAEAGCSNPDLSLHSVFPFNIPCKVEPRWTHAVIPQLTMLGTAARGLIPPKHSREFSSLDWECQRENAPFK